MRGLSRRSRVAAEADLSALHVNSHAPLRLGRRAPRADDTTKRVPIHAKAVGAEAALSSGSGGGLQFPRTSTRLQSAVLACFPIHRWDFLSLAGDFPLARKLPVSLHMRGIGARFVYILRSNNDPSRHYVGRTAT
jgi:hypothetical protein